MFAAPDIGPLLLAGILTQVTTALLLPTLPLFLRSRGLDLLQVGLAFTMVAASSVLVALTAARSSWLLTSHATITLLSIGSALSYALLIFATTPVEFVLIVMMGAWCGAAAGPGIQYLVADALAKGRTYEGYALLGSVNAFAYATGIIAGGLLAARSYDLVILTAVSTSLGATLILMTRWTRATPGAPAIHQWRVELSGARTRLATSAPVPAWSRRSARYGATYGFLFMLAVTVYPVYFPLFLQDHGLQISAVGFVIAASWITFGFAQPAGAWLARRTGRAERVVAIGMICFSAAAMGLLAGPLWIIIGAWVILGIADGISRPLAAGLLVEHVGRDHLASALRLRLVADSTARILGPWLYGLLAFRYSLSASVAASAIMATLAAIPILLLTRRPATTQPTPTGVPQ